MDLLAIISKKVFQAQAGAAQVGEVLPIDRYASSHNALEPLRDGGRLFLVTVRPGDELWLAAVLEEPAHDGEAWVAQVNRVAITDITALRGVIRFTSGKGISQKKGALGMSLQTPRALTAEDAQQILAAVGGASIVSEKEKQRASGKPAAKTRKRTKPKTKRKPQARTKSTAREDVVDVSAVVPEPHYWLVKEETKPAKGKVRFDDAQLASWRERLSWIVEHGTIGHFVMESDFLNELCRPNRLAAAGFIDQMIRAIDPARLLQRQLCGGVLDEWHWPAQEEAAARLGQDTDDMSVGGPFPHLVMHNTEANQIVVAGPEGVVLESRLRLPGKGEKRIHDMLYVDGDVLVMYLLNDSYRGLWLSESESFKGGNIGGNQVAVDGLGTANGAPGRPFKRGRISMSTFGRHFRRVFREGARYFRATSEDPELVDRANKDESGEAVFEVFDPGTGKAVAPGLPPWLTERIGHSGARLFPQSSFLLPVPPRAEQSPVGARDRLGGFALLREADGSLRAEGADGRSWCGRAAALANVPGTAIKSDPDNDDDEGEKLPKALITFPEREGCYLIRDDNTIFLPDGRTVLVPDYFEERFWGGAPQIIRDRTPQWLHLFQARDARMSRALRDCSREAAAEVLAGARRAWAAHSDDDFDVEEDPVRHCRPLARWPELAATLRRVFPAITDDRLIAGLVLLAIQAARAEVSLASLRDGLDAYQESIAMRERAAEVNIPWSNHNTNAWRLIASYYSGVEDGDLQDHLRSVDRFLFGRDAKPSAGDRRFQAGLPCDTRWEPLFTRTGELLFRLFAAATPIEAREQLRALLGLWSTTQLAQHPDELRWYELHVDRADMAGANRRFPAFERARNRYVLRMHYISDLGDAYSVVERSVGGEFVDPPTGVVREIRRPQEYWHGRDRLRAALQLYDERGPQQRVPREVLRRIAAETGLSETAAAVVWLGILHPWSHRWNYQPKIYRKALGVKVADVERAVSEVESTDLGSLYEAAMPVDAGQLLDPLAPGPTGESAVDRFIAAWNRINGQVKVLPTELVLQLEREVRRAPIEAVHAVRVLDDLERWAHFKEDARWVVRPCEPFMSNVSYRRGFVPAGWPKPECMGEEQEPNRSAVFDGRVLRLYLRYLPWAHQDLAVGHSVRESVARMPTYISERLQNPELLLFAGAIDLSRGENLNKREQAFQELVAPFEGPAYQPVDEGAGAEGYDHGDLVVTWPTDGSSGVFFSFRPSRITDLKRLEDLTRRLGLSKIFQRTGGGCACGLNFGRHQAQEIVDVAVWLTWMAPGFQDLCQELQEPSVAPGRYASDPRASRPDLVDAVRHRDDLSEDAAALLLQVLTLAEPTVERLTRVNDWSQPEHDAAAAELLSRQLVTEGKHPGAKRSLFALGPVLRLRQPAAPIEASKVCLYGLDPDPPDDPRPLAERAPTWRPPFDIVLPLRPLGDLFEAAWSLAEES